jgi:GNAT superfamily N-acetyltransferase
VKRFYDGIYLEAFAAQREPCESWLAALHGEAPYQWWLRLARDGDEIVGGITTELYPRSVCALVTYFVVAQHARGQGLGRKLHDDAVAALYARGARAVFGELDDPKIRGERARERVQRFERWGARVLDLRYIQPSLGEGLSRDRGLVLVAWPPPGSALQPLPSETVQAFYAELVAVTEGPYLDAELSAVLEDMGAHGSTVGLRPAW